MRTFITNYLLVFMIMGKALGTTVDGHACVSCTYKSETFDTCGTWSTSYVWCCTKSNGGAYINKQDTSTTVNGWGKCGAVAPTAAPTNSVSTCATYAVGWLVSQALGQGCAAQQQFWDLKKNNVQLSNGETATVAAGCCTAYADATCSDWTLTCPLGQNKLPAPIAPADGPSSQSTFTTLSQSRFNTLCCQAPTVTCSSLKVLWIAAALTTGGGCLDNNQFFDLKKENVEFTNTGNPAVVAACCSNFADATCADWPKTCAFGTALVPAKAAPADGPAGQSVLTTLGNPMFQDTCCKVPTTTKTCGAYSVAWGIAQLAGGGCASVNKFFNMKMAATQFSHTGDASTIAACCTSYADAFCFDWLKACTSGRGETVPTSTAPADAAAAGPGFIALSPNGYCDDWRYPTTGTTSGGYDDELVTPSACMTKCLQTLPGTTSFYLKGSRCGCSAGTSGACTIVPYAGYTSYLGHQSPGANAALTTLSQTKFDSSCCSLDPVTTTPGAINVGDTIISVLDTTKFAVGMHLTVSDYSKRETRSIVSMTTRRLASDDRRLASGRVTIDSPVANSYAQGATITVSDAPQDASFATYTSLSCFSIGLLTMHLMF